jgi:hypothetical protein
MDRGARPAVTALAYWNLMASKGMARKACPAAPEVGHEGAAFFGGLVLEPEAVDTDRERVD